MPRRSSSKPAALALSFGVVIAACGSDSQTQSGPVAETADVRYVNPTDSLPRIQFADAQISINDRCPVRSGKLSLRVPPVYVNGHPVAFC